MDFRILGPLEVLDGEQPIGLVAAKQRALLALLLLARGGPVSTDRLIEEMWNGHPPESALKSVQVYVSQLRKALDDGRIVTRDGGYELIVAPGEVDADRFEELLHAAAGAAPEQAAPLLREALALFRGEPLADLRLEAWAKQEADRLAELWLTAVERRIDAELALGLDQRLVAELDALTAAHPFREHLLEQLVLALYRSGRQAEALSAYRRGTARLRDDLGLEPGRALRELEQQILRQDRVLDAPTTPSARARRRTRWKLVLAGAFTLLIAAVAAMAAIVTRDDPVALVSVPPGIAILDSASGRLVAAIPPSTTGAALEAFSGDGSFWIWTFDGAALVRIDPRDGRILGRIGSPLGPASTWALVDGRSVWFTGTRLVRMDLARAVEIHRYALSADPLDDGLAEIARGAGSLWVARHLAGEVVEVDPATGEVERRFPGLTGGPYAIAFGDGAAWVVTWDGIDRIDAASGTVVHVPLPPPVAELAVGGGFAWVSNEAKGVVYKISRSGRVVDEYETGDGARRLSYDSGTLWVANNDVGTVTGIDAATGAMRVFRFSHPLASIAALHGRLLVELLPGRTFEERIGALRGRVLRVIDPAFEFDHPDPAISGNGYAHSFIFQAERATCAPLLGYPDLPPPRGQELVPEVAAARPVVSRDGRTYTFTVRKGFRFAPPSNAVLDAQTFRYSIERALDPRLGPRAPGDRFLGDLVGMHAFRSRRAAHVKGIRVRGDRISFTVARPSPDFLERLALPYFCPVPRGTPIVPEGVGRYVGPAPPGAGPYSFSGPVWNGEYAILMRNPNYGGSRPRPFDAIAYREGIDTQKAIGRVEQGGYDAVELYDPLLSPGSEIVRRFPAHGRLTTPAYRALPQQLTAYLAFDARRPPFSDPQLRRRVAAALDRNTLATISDLTPTDHVLPGGVRGGAPPHVDPGHVARRAVTPEAPTVEVRMAVASGNEEDRRFFDVVRAALVPLGVDVVPVAVPDVAKAIRDPRSRISLAGLTTSIDYPDPASFLARMLGTDIPASWLPRWVLAGVAHLNRLTGHARDRAAVTWAKRNGDRLPAIAYGAKALGVVVGPRVGCRVWNGVDPTLDLAALCLRKK